LYLKKTAEAVASIYHGYFPTSESALVDLPGVGKYTARAIMVFAYKQQVSMIDTNIRQIIVHFFFHGLPQKEKDIEMIADLLVPEKKSWEWHQALMDYGALELKNVADKTKRVPKKGQKPFRESDRYYRGRIVDALREKSWDEKKLVAYIRNFYDKSNVFVERIVSGLIKDGLVERQKKLLRLPQS
jgi:A/G-specific adenine glycosylase